MSDPVGLIGGSGGIGDPRRAQPAPAHAPQEGPTFKDLLVKNIDEVNKLQQDATKAVEDLAAGRTNDLESVLLATQKADTAFKALQATRNKVVEAYQEIQRMTV